MRTGALSLKPRIYVVTANPQKGAEAVAILRAEGIESDIIIDRKLEVQSSSLEEVALKAARLAYAKHKVPVAVDDSGLFIDALGGFPGVYSSYVYETIGIRGVLKLLENVPQRRACFRTVVAAIVPPLEIIEKGEVCGEISVEPRGERGFGFDPIFVPQGYTRTFAEMSFEEKNAISHRGR
ncbi:MAG: RdgB/HAM1 family non-canonical purine NTP pyrophosphatase, partial [Acidilobaceae archaeon]